MVLNDALFPAPRYWRPLVLFASDGVLELASQGFTVQVHDRFYIYKRLVGIEFRDAQTSQAETMEGNRELWPVFPAPAVEQRQSNGLESDFSRASGSSIIRGAEV